MAKKATNVLDKINESIEGVEEAQSETTENVEIKTDNSPSVETKEEISGVQMMWFQSNTEEEFLFFDNVGGVFTGKSPAYILDKCKKVKNPLYGN